MPNQLASTKRRQSLAEHEAVLSALAEIARHEGTTPMALLRQAARSIVKLRTASSDQAKRIRGSVMKFAPKPPKQFATAAQLARFKRNQREFDHLLLELNLSSPNAVETANSVVAPRCKISIIELEQGYANQKII